jgi:hypothetical protein
MKDVIVGGPGLVAVGPEGAVWTSGNGQQWQRISPIQAPASGLFGVANFADGLVAVGWPSSLLGTDDAQRWCNIDNGTAGFGQPINDPMAAAWLFSVAVTGTRVIAVGFIFSPDGNADEGAAVVWTTMIPSSGFTPCQTQPGP